MEFFIFESLKKLVIKLIFLMGNSYFILHCSMHLFLLQSQQQKLPLYITRLSVCLRLVSQCFFFVGVAGHVMQLEEGSKIYVLAGGLCQPVIRPELRPSPGSAVSG